MMTNDELKRKIVEIISPYVVERWHDKIADKLIAAGIGDVKEAELDRKAYEVASNQYRIWFEEQKYRAEVSERALELMARGECTFASPEFYKKQAEKELAEENGGKKEV